MIHSREDILKAAWSADALQTAAEDIITRVEEAEPEDLPAFLDSISTTAPHLLKPSGGAGTNMGEAAQPSGTSPARAPALDG